MTRTQRFVLIGSLTLATLIKAFLAWETPDTLDTIAYAEFLNEIRDGGAAVYDFRGSFNNLFIFPPAMIHLLKALGWVADSTGLPFRFWLRLLPSVADVAVFS